MANNVTPPGNVAAEKIRPSDIGTSKIKRESIEVNGRKWSYLDAPAQGQQKGVVFLIHGFPDQSLAWRYQIPLLTSLGLRCIALDCMGYGNTGSSSNLKDFSFKSHADAVAGIAKAIGVHKIVIGGHDWGGMVIWRVAQWYPDLVSHVFSVCTAYAPPMDKFISTEQLSKTILPQFGYQLQFGSEDSQLEKVIKDDASMRKFLKGIYGGKPHSGKLFMDPKIGINLSEITDSDFEMTPLLDQEEFDYYVSEFLKNGINGPCNWYRTRYINWEEDRKLPAETKDSIKQPTLYILATKDSVLTKEMSLGMEKVIPNLTRGEVPASHWALWQTPAETNRILKEWVEGVVLGGKSKL